MTQRERVMGGVVVGTVVVMGGFAALKSLVLGPFRSLVADTRIATIERANLKKYLRDESKWEAEWKRVGRRTLHSDTQNAQQMFREDIYGLLKRHGLSGKVPISPSQPKVNRKTEWTELIMGINVTGTVKQIIEMLRDCYRRPYYTQVQRLTIDAGKGKLRKGETSKPVTLSMKIATLVLPQKVEGVVLEPIGDKSAIADHVDETRLALAPEAYDQIAAINMFQWPPKRRIVKRGVIKDNGPSVPVPPGPPRPPFDPRRDADKMKVIACISLNGRPQVDVQNQDQLEVPPAEYRLNDEIEGEGRIILIRPDGMVIRDADNTQRRGGRSAETDYYYPLGGTFKQREKISRTSHPRLYAEIDQLASNR